MPHRALPLEGFDLRRQVPWTQLFQSFRLALRIRQLLLAAIGVTLTTVGWRLMEPSSTTTTRKLDEQPFVFTPTSWPWERDLGFDLTSPDPQDAGEPPVNALWALASGLKNPQRFFSQVFGNWSVTLTPVTELLNPGQRMFEPTVPASERLRALFQLLWWLVVWGLFGGALSRSAAVEFARDQSTHLTGALRFAGRNYLSFLVGPLLTLLAVLGVALLLALGGLFSRLPAIGTVVGGFGGGLALVIGLLLAILVMGLAVGWPLMFATISVEGTDGFDGMSRAFNYVYERPLLYLWQIVLSLVYGSFAVFCVLFLGQLATLLSLQGLSLGANRAWVESIADEAPALLAPPLENTDWALEADHDAPQSTQSDATRADATGSDATGSDATRSEAGSGVGDTIFKYWLRAWATLIHGFVYSFFWCSATLIYFVLRKSVDGNDLDEVFMGIQPEPDDLLPLVGAAAMGVDLTTGDRPANLSPLPPDNPPYAAPR